MADLPKDIGPSFTTCCYCLSLKTGCIIIGWYYLIGGSMLVLELFPGMFEMPKQTELGPVVAKILYVIDVMLTLGLVIAGVFLLIGVKKKNPTYFKPFLTIGGIFAIYEVMYIVLLATTPIEFEMSNVYQRLGPDMKMIMSNPVALFLGFGIFLYILAVVISYQKILKKTVPPDPEADI